MNAPILRLYFVLLVMLGATVVMTTQWSVLDADELRQRSENKRPLIAQQQVPRGKITTVDGEVAARSVPEGRGRRRIFVREYPLGSLFGNPVGYSFIDKGRTGIELSQDDVLVGEANEFATIIEQIRGTAREGSDLTLTIDAAAQRVATDALGGEAGSVVAIEPATGAVRAMVSVPGFNPNEVGRGLDLNAAPGSPQLNRATQARYAPGSAMKVVTASAALDSGEFTPESPVTGQNGVEIGGVPLNNFGSQDFGSAITLSTALTYSVNTAWATVGEQLGAETMLKYMRRFGFYSLPALDYPADQMIASGIRDADSGALLDADDPVDIGRVAIGQERLAVTPLQMAQVAAAVANDGELMEPTLVQEVVDPDGRTSEELDPDKQATVISAEAAAQVTEMMGRVTEEGTAAGLSVGVPFAGKTGTAEKNIAQGINQAWFIGFAPRDDPQIAVAATVETTPLTGGEAAGPIATAVIRELLG